MSNLKYWLWLSTRKGIAGQVGMRVLNHFGSPERVYFSDLEEYRMIDGLSEIAVKSLADKSLDGADRILGDCDRLGIQLLTMQDASYPERLAAIHQPPMVLYTKGRPVAFDEEAAIGIVGTRDATAYGAWAAAKLSMDLTRSGALVVSGMAQGIDAAAVRGALKAGGPVVSVLAGGIDVVYPREHRFLYEDVAAAGMLISEHPPGTEHRGTNFPIRNRIISGLSQGTVVVEGDLKSGAMITARTAILQGRDIYAFPGNVGETNSAGTNSLISDGAAIALSARDILENYAYLYRDSLDSVKLMMAEKRSGIDEDALIRLGVCTRTEKPKEAAQAPAESGTKEHGRRAAGTSQSPRPREKRETEPLLPPPHPSKPARGSSPKPARGDSPVSTHGDSSVPAHGDSSERALKSLNDTQRRIFEILPLDHAVPIDYLTREGFTVGEIMAAMTVLEIKGLTVTLPGGLYSRK
jgi:DNA processing protein